MKQAWSGAIKPVGLQKAGHVAGGELESPLGGQEQVWAPKTVPKKNKGKKATSIELEPFQRAFIDPPEAADLETINQVRASLEVTIDGEAGESIGPLYAFEELDILPGYAMKCLEEMECTTPMPIQAQALPIILQGHDLIGIAKTGSGKTLAYLLPALVHIEASSPIAKNGATPIALVMAPTRELAVQIHEVAYKLIANSKEGNQPGGIWASVVYGGKQKSEQVRNLWRGVHILVATPGRLMDLMQNNEVSLDRVTYFVLDEADRMLDCGFHDDVTKIASAIRTDRHMLFFSATWPKEVQDLAGTLCHDGQQPVRISVGQHEDGVGATRSDIQQEVVVFDQSTWEERDKAKQAYLYSHLRSVLQEEEHKTLVFVNSKVMADEMRDRLYKEGFKTESMHGGRPQQMRLDILEGFRKGETRLLVATDVMGRGLDIPDITHVVLYDMGGVDDYIHRIGRTARGLTGVGGHALTLFEYNHKWPDLAGGLVQVLSEAGQEVPPELQTIADQVASGERKMTPFEGGGGGGKKRKWKDSWNDDSGGWDGWNDTGSFMAGWMAAMQAAQGW